jgi:hypothetical protein
VAKAARRGRVLGSTDNGSILQKIEGQGRNLCVCIDRSERLGAPVNEAPTIDEVL